MDRDRLLYGLAAVFGATAGLVVLLGLAQGQPALGIVAVPTALLAYVFWYHSSGRLRERMTPPGGTQGRGGRETGGFGAGPREGFEGARGQRARQRQRRQQRRQRDQRAGESAPGVTPAEAYRRLGLDADADEAEVRRAYREKVKEVHPDRGGDEEEFKRVTEAYERLVG